MNGISIISTALTGHLKWFILLSAFSLLSACGGGGGGEDNTAARTIDTQAPVITINGEATINLIQGDEYIDLGAIAQDLVDGEITITIDGTVDTSIVGTYVITYTATDASGNTISITRTIHVLEPDITPPVISLIGLATLSINEGEFYVEYGATATDERDGTLEVSISGAVNSNVPGTYVVNYFAQDQAGNSASIERTVLVFDITAPVIILNGAAEISINEDTFYSELGATAVDAVNGPVNVVVTGNVNIATPGTYTINYSAVDASGNRANNNRTVIVLDVTAPVITLTGNNPHIQNENSQYIEPGYSANDNSGESVTVNVSGSVTTSTPGSYTLTYVAADSAGNQSSVNRIVNVLDVTAPIISLVGEAIINVPFNSDYEELGATSIDNVDGSVVVNVAGSVDTSLIASYQLIYTATDNAGNTATLNRVVNVLDLTAPVITLNGDSPYSQDEDSSYNEAGASAQDDVDAEVTVSITGVVDHTTPGIYTVTYSATDEAGNTSIKTRTVTILDITAPVVTLNGDNPFTQDEDGIYTELGATAEDNLDGETEVAISGTVDATMPGVYVVTYSSTDSAGNSSSEIRTVNILDITAPIISINGDTNTDVALHSNYSDLGASATDNLDEVIQVSMSGSVNTSLIGSYELTYSATDSAGNVASLIRTVHVIDVTAPIITLAGDNPYSQNEDSAYNEAGASAQDDVDADVSVSISGAVDHTTPGIYTLTYTATDEAGNTSTKTRTVTVLDITAPLITLNGANPFTQNEDSAYTELGATTQDNADGATEITISGTVDTTTPGNYLVTYSSIDRAGNASSVTRTVNILDVTAPVITLVGDNPVIQNEDLNYNEPGYSATDNGDENVSVVVTGEVNTATPGTYTLIYTATDEAGNSSIQTRMVNVLDITAPVITLNGDNPFTQDEDGGYTEQGATAEDNSDGETQITISSTIDTATPGIYLIAYSSIDSAGNSASVTRTVNILDITEPIITLNGDADVDVPFASNYADLGALATDNVDETIVVIMSGAVNTAQIGSYEIIYRATDSAGNTANVTRTVNVVDVTAPIITLNGGNSHSQNEDSTYNEAGASAQDDVDEEVSVSISGTVDHTTPGTYTLTYTATDEAGNTSTKTRTVTILDITAPLITLNGNSPFTQNEDNSYTEQGATAADNSDGATEITISGTVDSTTPGIYLVTYSSVDSAGNVASVTRTVNILDVTAPVITLKGANPVIQNEDINYSEPGYNAIDNSGESVTVIVIGEVNTVTPGNYSLTYSATDIAGNTTSVTRTINVLDVTAPVITLNGSNPLNQNEDGAYTEMGAIAQDNSDDEAQITISGTVDTATPGIYLITYSSIDSAGNTASITRTVNVLDITAPTITLNGDNPVIQNEDVNYSEAGYSVTDNHDESVTVIIVGEVDTVTPGNYTLTYSATDIAGNTSSVIRNINVLDTTPPVITLNGNNPFNQNEDDAYIELGATAQDNSDGNTQVTISGTVDTTIPGIYLVTYSTNDSAGNTASITRTVNVLDITAPVITLNGDNPVIQNEDVNYSEPGYSVTDNHDESVTVTIIGEVDTATPGNYTLTYSATDIGGNTGSVTRAINVLDITPPTITLNGGNPFSQNADEAYNEPGYNVIDNSGEILEVSVSGTVNSNTPGAYTLTYSVTDSAGNTSSVIRTVNVLDITPPVIKLNGEVNIDVPFATAYSDLGAIATDDVDGTIPISVSGSVNTSQVGIYELTYTGTDSAGNSASIIRRVNVVDVTAPVIELKGESHVTIVQGQDYSDPVTASDDVDGVIAVTIGGNLDIETVGSYTRSYTATDAAGNQTTATRTITVREHLAFITTWKTDNPGTSDNSQIMITTATSDQNYTIDWGDGSQDTGVAGGITHTYSSAGTYTVSISGDFKNIQFGYSNTDRNKILTIEQWGDIRWSTMESAFNYCENLLLNASDAPDLTDVTDMSKMFYGADAFNSDISQWIVSSVTDMAFMFADADVFNGDISLWDVSSVMDMRYMFISADAFNGDLSQWDVSSVTDMSSMFFGADAFNGDLSQWDVSSVTDMSRMFSGAGVFNGDISQWNVLSVISMASMFYDAIAFNGDLNQWDVSSVIDMSEMFSGAGIFNSDLSQWDVSSVTNMFKMFRGVGVFNGDISQWNVSSVTNMASMFYDTVAFNSDLSQWDVSSVINMVGMFHNASVFNSDIGQWDVSSVKDMDYMFYNSTVFNSDLSQWDVSLVRGMDNMFRSAIAFDSDLSQWDVSSVISTAGMFYNATVFNSDLSQWDVSSVQDMGYMFYEATIFNSNLSQWDVSSVQDMGYMFYEATIFNSNLSQWDVSSLRDMRYMFNSATAFNSDLGQWRVSLVANMDNIFTGVTLSTENYDSLLHGWTGHALPTRVNFNGGNSQYSSAAQSARDTLVNSYDWTVTDGGLQTP